MGTINDIKTGRTALGIELGSSRIKAVLVDFDGQILAQGNHSWENQLVDGIWTYALSDVWTGIRDSYQNLAKDVKNKYDVELTTFGSIGISAMMHGYLPFDKNNELLTPFRTWRNTMTEDAVKILIQEFNFNIPQRWSIAHLYHAILNQESHVKNIDYVTTLSGYVHWQLAGEKVLGIGDASGMFPISDSTNDYDQKMIEKFDALIADQNFSWQLSDILPEILCAGENAGYLTEAGAKLLDPSGKLEAGIPMAPPEGDAGTGMVATNSVLKRTGNISAGTSIFAMIVLEHSLKKVHEEIDMVTTPSGSPVAMVHCNNCTSDFDAWVRVLDQLIVRLGLDVSKGKLYDELYFSALEGDKDCGGIVTHNYVSGEHITGFEEGRPLVVRTPDANFNLANFMRAMLNSTMATLRIGMDILTEEEDVHIDKMLGHGGLFKTERVGQTLMANALKTPISVMESAGEGGAWGMALLALYLIESQSKDKTVRTLEEFLEELVFSKQKSLTIEPNEEDMQGFDQFLDKYKASLSIQRAAIDALK
ncbi:MAG TPA: FGGY-family carbohydrate kinase [Clostridiaceae bacterium]|nr:FGGY-family carbohydrate kinase [Clostridiaceae bacterium]